MKPLLEADGIQLQFDNRQILSSIYIKCERGKITGLLGRNGQGKSCLMKAIYGTLECERSVRIEGQYLREAFRHPELVRYLPQFGFIPRFLSLKRVFDDFNLDLGSFIKRFPQFQSYYKTPVGSLSGGGQRLVELFLVVKSPTKLVLLDEPFTHLSPLQMEQAKELLAEEKENKGILLTDHMFRHVLDLADHSYLLVDGKTHTIHDHSDVERLGYARV